MKCELVVIHETGGPDVLRLEMAELAEPGPGQALVRQTAIGLNFIDTYHRTGLYPLPVLPHGIGTEAVGVVEAVGPDVSVVAKGQRVAYVSGPPGAYASARLLSADQLIALPDDVEDEVAAAVLLKGMTVEYLIHRTYPVRSGEWVLFHAASGGVGSIACQWLASKGVRVIGTVGTHDKARLARENGCEVPVVYTEEDFAATVLNLTEGQGLGVVFDSVGKRTFSDSLRCLAPRGLMVSFGNASGKPDPIEVGSLAQHGSLFLTRPSLVHYTRTRFELLESAARVFEAVRAGHIRVQIGQSFSLRDVQTAHRELESRKTIGSTVLRP